MNNEGEELLPADTDLANECNKEEQANINQFCFRAGRLPLLFCVPVWLLKCIWLIPHRLIVYLLAWCLFIWVVLAQVLHTNKTNNSDATGDMRVNEQVLLTLFHTVWVRQHNHLASRLKTINPSWDDEKLFQETRRIVVAQLQHVTYNEYLPPIFGKSYIRAYATCLTL